MSALLAAASAVACLVRSSSPLNDEAGSSGEASGSGASGPCGATTVNGGGSGLADGGVPYDRASHAATASTAAVTATSLDGRRRIRILQEVLQGGRAWLTTPARSREPNRS